MGSEARKPSHSSIAAVESAKKLKYLKNPSIDRFVTIETHSQRRAELRLPASSTRCAAV